MKHTGVGKGKGKKTSSKESKPDHLEEELVTLIHANVETSKKVGLVCICEDIVHFKGYCLNMLNMLICQSFTPQLAEVSLQKSQARPAQEGSPRRLGFCDYFTAEVLAMTERQWLKFRPKATAVLHEALQPEPEVVYRPGTQSLPHLHEIT